MILNQQRSVRIPVRSLNEFLAKACKAVRVSPDALTVCLVTNPEMARWNGLYRGKNRPTDVLSFPVEPGETRAKGSGLRKIASRGKRRKGGFDDSSISAVGYLGDIAIAPKVAQRNAVEFGRTFADEMRILILHGILHLMGYDHETDSGQMERRERRLRRTLGLIGSEGPES